MPQGDFVLSHHARERMQLRRIDEASIHKTLQRPDQQLVEADGDTRFIRTLHGREYHVVASYLADEKRWLIVSAWVRGESDPLPLWRRLVAWLRGLIGSSERKKPPRRTKGH